MEPVDDLEDRMCPTHDQPFNLYCSTDQKAICVVCSALEHKNHTLVSLKEAFEQEKVSLQQTVAENQRLTCEGSAARALSELETSLSQKFNKVFKDELRRVQQFAVDVTLDPDTANPYLVLSEDLKQVHDTNLKKQLPDSPQRFDKYIIVLGKQSFSSSRFYFEVQVKGKTEWILGVARESVDRKRLITLNPKNGFWTIWLRDGDKYKALDDCPVSLSPQRDGDEYKAADDPSVPLSPQKPPQKVGVFVDYGAGLVSFYDVDSKCFTLIVSFTYDLFVFSLIHFSHLLITHTTHPNTTHNPTIKCASV
uniref:Uncharacterized protein n=1 Tax=Neogobius melanostomus TaxID=47308 RepID=A0A8C6T695_9GOBI